MRHSTPFFRRWTGALLLSCGLLAGSPAPAQRIDDGLVAHYPFEGNLDEAAGIDTRPVARGTLEYPTTGAIGRSLRVSGDDEIDFVGIPDSTFAGDFTIAWFMNLGSGDYYLFGKEATCDSSSNYFSTVAEGAKLLAAFASTTASATAVGTAPRGRWAHVALVRSGSQATLYVDGVAGSPRALPALSLGAIAAPFGLGNSPCVGRALGSPLRPVGGIDELRIYASALAADKIQALARRPSFSATPRAATVGGRTVVRASHLVLDRSYELRLVGPATSTLFKGPATAIDMTWTVTLPSVPPGSYKLYLVATLARGLENIERSIPFTVSPPLTIAASSPLQAGKRATFSIGNLLKDGATSVRLSYAGRVIAGPAAVEGTTRDFTVVLPTDHPASLPANVTLRAEQLYGRIVSHVGTSTGAVAAPFTGRFATADQVSTSLAQARPGDTAVVSGKLTLADGATPADTDVTAYWVGDNGDVTPLSVKDLSVDAQGNFRLDTRPPSLGSMTAVKPQSGGRIRLVAKRTNSLGRVEWVTQEGPRFETVYDTDPATDISVRVHRTIGGGQTQAVEGAYVVLSSSAPLGYELDLPGQGGSGGPPIGGGSLYGHRQPLLGQLGAAAKGAKLAAAPAAPALNQLAPDGVVDLPPPPAPACGNELYRRYTDATGEAEFPVLGGPEEEGSTYQRLSSMQLAATDCSADGCLSAEVLQTFEFFVTVYTLHKGAGYIRELDRTELPTIFRVKYTRNTETFEIRNVRTGETSVQQTSANLYVEVPTITANNHITIYPPSMYHEAGGVPISAVPLSNGKNFGYWLDFAEFSEMNFTSSAPEKILEFKHQPDVNGSLTSAALYLNLKGNPVATKVGDFSQVSFVDGCNLQDLPSANKAETWRLQIPGLFHYFWRYPDQLFFDAGGERKVCGHIVVNNAVREGVKRDVCFRWSPPPGWANGSSFLKVNDSDINAVLIEQSGRQIGAHATQTALPNSFLGEELEEPRDVDNRTNARSAKYALIGPNGPMDESSAYAGANPKQFNQGSAGADDLFDPPSVVSTVEIGEDEFQTILDTTIPLFQWYWGVPEIFSAEVFARLRLLASYYFYGTMTTVQNPDNTFRTSIDMLADALFGVVIMIGVDVDVLFGVIIDAGADLSGYVLSEMPVKLTSVNGTDVQSDGVKPCLNFRLVFSAFVDPCTVCPTPVIRIGGDPDGVIVDARTPDNCELYSTQNKALAKHGVAAELAALAKTDVKALQTDVAEMRAARRHPALDFDRSGNGMLLSRNDAGQLVAQGFDGATLSMESQLTAAMGARDPQIAYYDVDRAVAVWAESALPELQFRNLSDPAQIMSSAERVRRYAREQRLAWAVWDGDSWSPKTILTANGRGEGQIGLTACHAGQPGCPAGGEVLAVWQRNANFNDGDAGNDATTLYRLWYSRFTPASGFAAPALVDSPSANVQDITPSATYVGGRPVVVWARQFGGSLEDFKQRNLAYRVIPDGVALSVGSAEDVIAPSVVAANTGSIRVAWLRADDSTSTNPKVLTAGAVGTNNALYVTQASCNATTCSFPQAQVPATRDEHGRRLYGGERPRLIKGENDVVLTMRVFRLENPNQPGQTTQVGDPIGAVLNTGDLMLVAPNFFTGIARVTPLTADGFMHSSPVVAYNPVSRVFVAGSTLRVPPFSAPFRAALKASGYQGHVAHGKSVAANGNLQLTSIVEAPDLHVESVVPQGALAPGVAQVARVVVANRGVGYRVAEDGPVTLELRWNSPGGPTLASYTLSDLEAGGAVPLDIAWTAPADAFVDEAHTLHAVLRTPAGFTEITDGNNQASHAYPGLPVPRNVGSSLLPGVPHVQLGWEPAGDERVAGYRVYIKQTDGQWAPLGASPVNGFLDLAASFHLARTYAISSYSARGVESGLSEEATVMPLPKQGALPELLRDGFEAVAQ